MVKNSVAQGKTMKTIIDTLEKIKASGSFCAKRALPVDRLKLEIKEMGTLKFPLTPNRVKALIALAKPAKFGLRDKTLLDKKVRNAWEISKSKIKLDAQWKKELNLVLEGLKKDLGLAETATLTASLHNLLVYEAGQFFDFHQDSEKTEHMVATLVVVLPSAHNGGTLVIDNQGDKKQFQSSRFALDKLTCIAFYADCHHAVKEVTSGYRVALTYNLSLENTASNKINVPSKKADPDLINRLQAYFIDENTTSPLTPKKYVYLLDHQYTEKGLSWEHLKNADNARAEAFRAAADALNLEICLALAEVQETWDCEFDYDSYSHRHRRSRYHHRGYDDETPGETVTLTDLITSETTIKHCIDVDNNPKNYKEFYVPDAQITWTKANNELAPFESEYEGFMGNYGNTMDHWYHRAAIILWPKEKHYAVLFDIDPNSAMTELLALTKKKNQEEWLRTIVRSILPYWSSKSLRSNSDKSFFSAVFKLSLHIKDPELAQAILSVFSIEILTAEIAAFFLQLQESYGTIWCTQVLEQWADSKDPWRTISKCNKMADIITVLSNTKAATEDLMAWLLNHQLNEIKKYSTQLLMASRVSRLEKLPESIKEMIDFIKACVIAEQHPPYNAFLEHVMEYTLIYPPLELMELFYFLEKNIKQNDLKQWGYFQLFEYVFDAVQKENEAGLRQPDDWAMPEKSHCTCEDCNFLNDFLQSSTSKTIVWPMAKNGRAHIHNVIDGLGIAVTHQTQRTGSPHKLILTKTNKLHLDSKIQFQKVNKAFLYLSQKKNLCDQLT